MMAGHVARRQEVELRARAFAPWGLVLAAALVLSLLPGAPEVGAATPEVTRLAGSDRIGTAIAVSTAAFPDGAQVAVVANDRVFADALAATPLAAAAGGPVLLNPRDHLHADVEAEIERLGAEVVYLMGGTAAQASAVAAALEAMASVDEVSRLGGDDRFGTAAHAAREAVARWREAGDADAGRHALVALGQHPNDDRAWPDALAAGPLAAHAHRPILLVRQGEVPQATRDALDQLAVEEVTVVGGPAAIPESTAQQLGATGRIGGEDRYHTSTLLADAAAEHGASHADVVAVTGLAFPDGLAAGPAAFALGGVLVLVHPAHLADSAHTLDWLARRKGAIEQVRVGGGPAAVSAAAADQVRRALVPLDEVALRYVELPGAYTRPVFVTSPPGDTRRLFVVEQRGRILLSKDGGAPTPFLNIEQRVNDGGNEQGLLGMAFHPRYPEDPRFFVYYTVAGSNDTRLESYERSATGDLDAANRDSDREILRVEQFAANHNGGMLAFGPDGKLYLALGDGGGSGDPQANGQDPSTLLGSILRLDVDHEDVPLRYRIPGDNPFFFSDGDERGEVWAHGLRNPWRFAFDPVADLLLVADVGQDRWEEINAQAAEEGGRNYGWNRCEGNEPFEERDCDPEDPDLSFPIHVYPIEDEAECAVVGGYVYRGRALPELTGTYFYADNCVGGAIWSLRTRGDDATDQREWPGPGGRPTSFGIDANGELYITTLQGPVLRIDLE